MMKTKGNTDISVVGGLSVPIVAGNWNNGSNAGVFYLHLNNNRTNSNNNVSGRS